MSGNQVGRRMPEKAKIICPPPSGVDIITVVNLLSEIAIIHLPTETASINLPTEIAIVNLSTEIVIL